MNNLKITDVIGKFSGDENDDIEQWIDRLETAVQIFGKKEDIVKLIPLFLSGSAYVTWKQMKEDEKKRY